MRPVHGHRQGPGRSNGGHHVRARIGGHRGGSAVAGRDAGALGGCGPPNKELRYSADPPTVEEIVLGCVRLGRAATRTGSRADRDPVARGVGIGEALALTESELDPKTGSVLVRAIEGGRRGMVGMDEWGWEHVAPRSEHRVKLPIGPLFCILAGPRGRGWSATAARGELRRLAAKAGGTRRFAPHQLPHAQAIEMAHEGIPLPIIQRQLGHAHLGITSIIPKESIRARSSTWSTTGDLL